MRCVVPGSVEDTCGALDEECRRQTWYCGGPMPRPTNSEAPALFWFYRLVGIGAIVGAVALSKRNDSDPYAEARRRNAAFLKDSIRRYGRGDIE